MVFLIDALYRRDILEAFSGQLDEVYFQGQMVFMRGHGLARIEHPVPGPVGLRELIKTPFTYLSGDFYRPAINIRELFAA